MLENPDILKATKTDWFIGGSVGPERVRLALTTEPLHKSKRKPDRPTNSVSGGREIPQDCSYVCPAGYEILRETERENEKINFLSIVAVLERKPLERATSLVQHLLRLKGETSAFLDAAGLPPVPSEVLSEPDSPSLG